MEFPNAKLLFATVFLFLQMITTSPFSKMACLGGYILQTSHIQVEAALSFSVLRVFLSQQQQFLVADFV